MDKFYVPISILIAGVLIGGAVLSTSASDKVAKTIENTGAVENNQVTPERENSLIDPRRASARNLYGSPDAEVTIIEFSDYECPFCARVHPTLQKIVDESDGAVNWEFRHLPLVIHSNARDSALAAECVSELAGNDAFWEFSNYLFANQRTLGESVYTNGARAVGIEASDLAACMDREDIAARVLEDERTAMALGGSGTPYNVIRYKDGSTRAVPGALPYNQFKALVRN